MNMNKSIKYYLKILFGTSLIQLIAIILGLFLIFISGENSRVSLIIWFLGYFISLVFDIIMAIRSTASIRKKLAFIFLMPTNYSPLALLWVAIMVFAEFFRMLS